MQLSVTGQSAFLGAPSSAWEVGAIAELIPGHFWTLKLVAPCMEVGQGASECVGTGQLAFLESSPSKHGGLMVRHDGLGCGT